jgi:hypothetical protein
MRRDTTSKAGSQDQGITTPMATPTLHLETSPRRVLRIPLILPRRMTGTGECDASFRGICVLAFVKKGTEDQISSINTAVITKLGKAGAAFKFLVINGPCQLSFAERFDVSFDMMPAYAVYSPSKGRTVSFKESISTEKVYLFLDAVLGGRATTYAIAQRPTLGQECELDENDADSMLVEEEPMDDFLEEIRREEEEKAAALAKELKEEQKKRKEEEKKKAEEAKAAPKKVKKVIKKKKSKKSEL